MTAVEQTATAPCPLGWTQHSYEAALREEFGQQGEGEGERERERERECVCSAIMYFSTEGRTFLMQYLHTTIFSYCFNITQLKATKMKSTEVHNPRTSVVCK